MNTFNSILLIVIFILIVSDVFFLWKIFKNLDKKKKNLPDERYFELKYNINLLKAVSAILIFLIGFLGFNTYNNISNNLEENFTEKVKDQNDKIENLISKISTYEQNIESLKSQEGESVKNLDEINQKFRIISEKLKNNQEALKYTSKVYVVKNLKFPVEKLFMEEKNMPKREDLFTIKFKDLRTIYDEKLPIFKSEPMVIVIGKSLQLNIIEINKEFLRLDNSLRFVFNGEKPEDKFYYFDLWIAEPN